MIIITVFYQLFNKTLAKSETDQYLTVKIIIMSFVYQPQRKDSTGAITLPDGFRPYEYYGNAATALIDFPDWELASFVAEEINRPATIHNCPRSLTYYAVSPQHPNAMLLQSVGWVQGTPAKELKEGSYIMWNFGSIYIVNKIDKITEHFLHIKTSSIDGKNPVYSQRLKKDRLICLLKSKS